ncbi:MAG TPA: quinone oxidoreductase [Verrucomicrobiae bacterium]|jgi:NADPH2:quinone reductase|nr:quinone oxidoreductase [Verrucomicrobiae bacterium]
MEQAYAIRFNRIGGPEVLAVEQVVVGAPQAGHVLLRHTAIGLNYIDTYHRSGLYPVHNFPSGIGLEAAGVIERVGDGVTDLKQGDRVAYATGPIGAYSQLRIMPADKLVKIPEGIDDKTAAAMMLKGLTAQYLLRRTYKVQSGDAILVHAASGGVGMIMTQWAKHLGAMVIGTVGSPQKATVAKAHGCDHTILYRIENFAARVKDFTKGKGVAVVYDGVGKDTFMGSLDCLSRLGMMVSYGNASGPVPPFDISILNQKGSLFLSRPSLMGYAATREELVTMAAELFDVVKSGAVKIEINQTYKLRDAAQAHRDLESRKTTGCTVILP